MPQKTTAQWTWTLFRIVLTLAAGGAAGAVGTVQYHERVVEARVDDQRTVCEEELRRAAETCIKALAECPVVCDPCGDCVCPPAPDCICNPVPCYCCDHIDGYGCNCDVDEPEDRNCANDDCTMYWTYPLH